MPNLLRIAGLVPAATLFATATASASPIETGYSIMGTDQAGKPVTIARVVLKGADAACPELKTGGNSVKTVARVNPDPDDFPIQVCEALIEAPAQVAGRTIPGPPKRVARVTIVGDSGCKPKHHQQCKAGGDSWPFQTISRTAATADPDLLLHMGDYNYRGTPGHIRIDHKRRAIYDAGDNSDSVSCRLKGPYHGQNSIGSDTPDQWHNWKLDFFDPADDLNQAAPWVVARGNHELCSRAGPGYFYLLDPGSDLAGVGTGQRTCPPAAAAEPLVFTPPYLLDLPGMDVLVLDSANACDHGVLHQAHFDSQFAAMQQLIDDAPTQDMLILQTHRPVWAVRAADDTTAPGDTDPSGKYAYIDVTLQAAYRRYPLPRPLHLVVSGHMHRFQALGFGRDYDQLVALGPRKPLVAPPG